MSDDRMARLRSVTPERALQLAGCKPHRRPGRWAPCPACGCDYGSVVGGDVQWRCWRASCGVTADAPATAALLAVGTATPPPDRWPDVLSWAVERGWIGDDTPAVAVAQTVRVSGRLPPMLDTLAASLGDAPWLPGQRVDDDPRAVAGAWAAVAAGVPAGLAMRGARDYHAAREQHRLGVEREMQDLRGGASSLASVVLARPDDTPADARRRHWVRLWRETHTADEWLTVPRRMA